MKKDSMERRLQSAYRKKLESQMQDNKTLEDLKFECKIKSTHDSHRKNGTQQNLLELIDVIRSED